MGVPDELRTLDDDLAAGRVDAGAYRRRRDDLLAARARAVTPGGPDAPDDPAPDPELAPEGQRPPLPVVPGPRPLGSVSAPPLPGPRAPASSLRPPPGGEEPATAGRPAPPDPFPPPFRWAPPGPGSSPDVTHVVPSASVGATQVVRGAGGPGEATTATADRTRVVPGAAVARSVTRSVTPAATTPPWAAAQPAAAPGPAAALQRRQGAEVFVRSGPKPTVLISTTLVVLVAALVVVFSVVLS